MKDCPFYSLGAIANALETLADELGADQETREIYRGHLECIEKHISLPF